MSKNEPIKKSDGLYFVFMFVFSFYVPAKTCQIRQRRRCTAHSVQNQTESIVSRKAPMFRKE